MFLWLARTILVLMSTVPLVCRRTPVPRPRLVSRRLVSSARPGETPEPDCANDKDCAAANDRFGGRQRRPGASLDNGGLAPASTTRPGPRRDARTAPTSPRRTSTPPRQVAQPRSHRDRVRPSHVEDTPPMCPQRPRPRLLRRVLNGEDRSGRGRILFGSELAPYDRTSKPSRSANVKSAPGRLHLPSSTLATAPEAHKGLAIILAPVEQR
jgi:hypothetical protein